MQSRYTVTISTLLRPLLLKNWVFFPHMFQKWSAENEESAKRWQRGYQKFLKPLSSGLFRPKHKAILPRSILGQDNVHRVDDLVAHLSQLLHLAPAKAFEEQAAEERNG